MILDSIDQLGRYALPFKQDILNYLNSRDPLTVPDGEHEIKGRDLFVRVMSHIPKPTADNKLEAHRIHADLQFIAAGVEMMQTVPTDQLRPVTDYDAAGDFQFYTADGYANDFVLRTGQFAVFFPGEAHRPGCLYQDCRGPVKKLVFKIRMI